MTYVMAMFESYSEMKEGKVWGLTLVDAESELIAALKLPVYTGRAVVNKLVAINEVPVKFRPLVAHIRRGEPIETREDKEIIAHVIEELGEAFRHGKPLPKTVH